MFTARLDALHIAFRLSGFVRADLTALPLVIQPRRDSLRYSVLANCKGFTFYQTSPLTPRITLLALTQAIRADSFF